MDTTTTAPRAEVLRRLVSPCNREVWEDAFPELLRTAPADTTAV
ncbi:hypothetical protein AB0941_33280 [Streptomyces sp. NPDC013433]